jgi:hypothetical protein
MSLLTLLWSNMFLNIEIKHSEPFKESEIKNASLIFEIESDEKNRIRK